MLIWAFLSEGSSRKGEDGEINMNARMREISEGIFEGQVVEVKISLNQALIEQLDPGQLLNEAIFPAIRNVGESMEEGDFFMPEIKISTKALLEAAEILRPHIICEEDKCHYTLPPWTCEGDTDDVGVYLKSKIDDSLNLPAQQQMGILDMIAKGLDTHEFTPCKIQATEAEDS